MFCYQKNRDIIGKDLLINNIWISEDIKKDF